MIVIAIEIGVCLLMCIGIIVVAYAFCFRNEQQQSSSDRSVDYIASEHKETPLSSSSFLSTDEEQLVQSALISQYEQQRIEIIERQKAALDVLSENMTITIINESGYISPPHTPHSLYECTGFASMEGLEVSNPLFSCHMSNDDNQVFLPLPSSVT